MDNNVNTSGGGDAAPGNQTSSAFGSARRSVTFETTDSADPAAGQRLSRRSDAIKTSSTQSRTPSASSARSTSSGRLSLSMTKGSAKPGSRGGRPSNATLRGRINKRGSVAAKAPPPDPLSLIASKALNSLSMPALQSLVASANRARPKERRAALHKVQATVLRAHQDGAKAMEQLFMEESEAMFGVYLRESLVLHSREITLLQTTLTTERETSQRRLNHAADTTDTLFKGLMTLLDTARGAGASLCEKSGLFATPHDASPATSAGHRGRPMPEVRDQEASWCPTVQGEAHAPTRVSDTEREAMQQMQAFFRGVTDGVRGVVGPSQASHTVDAVRAGASNTTPGSTAAQATSPVPAAVLGAELDRLSNAFAALLNQLYARDEQQRHEITAQKRVLDENATRLKLADDVLRDTVQQESREVSYAVRCLQELDATLRARMDAVEEGTQLALAALIADKTDVCMENGVYSDKAALVQYREDAVHRFVTRMDGLKVEQAEMLRTVQEELIAITRREARRGREEKVVDVHSVLPAATRTMLEERCDKATLLRFLHHVTLHNEEAARLLLGAVSEYDQYLDANPNEAIAVRERSRAHAAVTALLTKMYEESLIASNPNDVRPSLTDTVESIVAQYNAFIGFHAEHARAQLRQNEHRAAVATQRQPLQPGHGGFFDASVPLPASMVQPDGTTNPNPYSATLYQPRSVDRIFTSTTTAGRGQGLQQQKAYTPSPPSTAQHRAGSGQAASSWNESGLTGQRAVAERVVCMQRANPSQDDVARAASTSVVGQCRWGDMAPVQHAPAYKTRTGEGMRAGGDALAHTQPLLPRVTGRSVSSVTAALAQTSFTQSVPAPAVPARKLLAEHVLSEYSHNHTDALAAVKRYQQQQEEGEAQAAAAATAGQPGSFTASVQEGRSAASPLTSRERELMDDYVPGQIRATFAPLIMGEDTLSDAARAFPAKRRQLAYQDGDTEYIERQRSTFSAFSAPHVNYA